MSDAEEFQNFVNSAAAEAFVGPRWSAYKSKWERIYSRTGHLTGLTTTARWKGSLKTNRARSSWNWGAFFFGIIWLLYRKMYWGATFVAAIWLSTDFIFLALNKDEPAIVNFIPCLVIARYGDYQYFERTFKWIKKLKAAGVGDAEAAVFARQAGGVSWVAAIGGTAAGTVIYIALFWGFTLVLPDASAAASSASNRAVAAAHDTALKTTSISASQTTAPLVATTRTAESSGTLDGSWTISAAMTDEVAHCDLTNQVDSPPVASGVNWSDPREFHITYALGTGHFILAAINLGGAELRPGASLSVEMHLGDQPAWIAAAHIADEKTLVWTMTIANMATMEQQMHDASGNLVLAFPNSLNADVSFPLEGSSAAMDNLSACIKAITAGAAAHGGRGMGHSPVYSSHTDARLR